MNDSTYIWSIQHIYDTVALYAIMMQDRKDMREKNIQPKIYWDEKIDAKWV